MRTDPSLDAESGVGIYDFVRNGSVDSFNSLTIFFPRVNTARVFNNTEISSTAGQAGSFSSNSTFPSGGKVAFDAEL